MALFKKKLIVGKSERLADIKAFEELFLKKQNKRTEAKIADKVGDLIEYLKDTDAEVRKAAALGLSKTSNNTAATSLCHYVVNEKDAETAKVMREAAVIIRKNIEINR